MDQEPGADDGEFRPSARAVRALRVVSAVLVLGVAGPSVLVVGTEADSGAGRLTAALVLVAAQAVALWWVIRRPATVLAATVVMGIAMWSLFPAVSLTGALLAAQFALCVLSTVRPARVSRWWLLGVLALAPLALVGGGTLSVPAYVLAVTLAWTAGQWRRAQHDRLVAETRRAVAEERARIAREVHDVVAHTVSVMVIQAGAAEDVFTENPEQARQALRAIDDAGRSALSELRLLLHSVRPDTADDGRQPPRGMAQLDELAAPVRAAGVSVEIRQEGRTAAPAAAVDLAGYRIVQEALTNTLRHAVDATEVRVSVSYDPEYVHIAVVDNGRRPPGRSSYSAGAGRGLMGMRERASLLGGNLAAGPGETGGFEVRAELPIGYAP
ncbi:sensor histidine kinase [Streptomyces inhibens]|uniref:sensor histidine kinase n=1 Tax=Streptomyces inhibens TaxID=2293571 RepID=UPI00402AF008